MPDGFTVAADTGTQLTLSWNAVQPTSQRTIVRYDLFLNGTKIASTTATEISAPYDPSGATLQFFSLRAVDDLGKSSNPTNEIRAQPFSGVQLQVKSFAAGQRKVGVLYSLTGDWYLTKNFAENQTGEWANWHDPVNGFGSGVIHQSMLASVTYHPSSGSYTRSVTGSFTWDDNTGSGIWRLDDAGLNAIRDPAFGRQYAYSLAPFSTDNWGSDIPVADWFVGLAPKSFGEWLSDRYTDEMLTSLVASEYQTVKSAVGGADWNTITSIGAGEVRTTPIYELSSDSLGLSAHAFDQGGKLKSVSMSGARYGFLNAGFSPLHYVWAEVTYGFDGTARGTTVRECDISVNGASPEYAIDAPTSDGYISLITDLHVRLQSTPSLNPATGTSRLYDPNGVFINEVAVLDLAFASSSSYSVSGDAAIQLVAMDRYIYYSQGAAAAVVAGLFIPPGADLAPYLDAGLLIGAVGVAPGSAVINVNVGGATVTQKVNVYAVPTLAVDADRDGVVAMPPNDLSADYADQTTADRPYRFWLNDDFDGGGSDTSGDDIPADSAADFKHVTVQGNRDLVDWFPVALDIKQLLSVLPANTPGLKYKLKQADGAVNFVYTNLTRDQAFSYQRPAQGTAPLSSGFGLTLSLPPGSADKCQVTADGVDLFNAPTGSAQFLDAIQNHNGGVILVEGRAVTNAPLVLSVEKDGNVIAEVKLYLSICGVETMFRHLNLRDLDPTMTGLVGTKGDTAPATSMGDPAGFPDAQNSSSDHWLIFLHGYNVSGQKARGWNAEMFKRFYWSHNKARFVGVSWFSDPSDPIGPAPADYHLAVRNAMATAFQLASTVNALPGFKSTVSHSLGCGVVASAISDHGMLVNKACFVDAALARECFDGELSGDASGMTPIFWRNYDPTFYATNWYQRFAGTNDARRKLTWRNRFSNAESDVHNFYSSTENVLSEYDGEVPEWFLTIPSDVALKFGAYTWVFQEKAKGARENYLLGYTHAGSYYMGWGFNLTDPMYGDPQWYYPTADNFGTPGRRPKTPGEIGSAALWLDTIKRTPVFKTGWGRWDTNHPDQALIDTGYHDGPDWIFNLYDAIQGDAQAGDPFKRAQLLAEAIPALTWPVGSHTVTAFGARNCPLTTLVDNWPRANIGGVPEWRHSDMHDVAYLYEYRVFDNLVALSNQ